MPPKHCNLVNNLKSLYGTGLHSDVTLQVDGHDFKAHKGILASRSSVFATMFQGEFKEQQTGVVKVNVEFKSEAIEEMLKFLYTTETSDNLPEMALDLFKVADYYDIEDLKTVCVQSMLENTKVENVAQIFVLAKKFELIKLKNHVLEFIRLNHQKVMKSSEYRELYSSSSNVILEIDDYIASKTKQIV